jgi:hypothetical protein
MRKSLLICLALFVGFCSCKKSTAPTLSGIYTEQSPVSGQSQLNFVSSTLLIITWSGSTSQDSLYYVVGAGNISLTPAWSNLYPASYLDFLVIDNNTLRIESLNARIPEDPKTYMIFKK